MWTLGTPFLVLSVLPLTQSWLKSEVILEERGGKYPTHNKPTTQLESL